MRLQKQTLEIKMTVDEVEYFLKRFGVEELQWELMEHLNKDKDPSLRKVIKRDKNNKIIEIHFEKYKKPSLKVLKGGKE